MSVPETSEQKFRRAVFVDRDGVLNRSIIRDRKPYPPSCLDELEILPGVENACRQLKDASFVLVCITNQPDVAWGTQSLDVVEKFTNNFNKR